MRSLMLEHGFDVHPLPDGKIHRFRGPEDKNRNGWYVFHGDHGAFGHWKTGDKVTWIEKTTTGKRPKRQVLRETTERNRTEQRRHADTAKEARAIWNTLQPAIEHPYLTRKQITPHGIRVNGDRLVVPLTIDTHIYSLQFIADASKIFLKGGRVKGCYYPIGKLTNPLWVAEGFATAASVHEVTNDAAICAFNAGNLVAVVEHFIKMGLNVFVAADADDAGWTAAMKARKAGATYAVSPDFGDQPGTDWNDYAMWRGPEHTYEALYRV
jgi:putative DNA primase/helicase